MKQNRYLIYIIFSFKILISGFFSSPYNETVFVPFLQLFSERFYNAWSISETGFPYPPLLTAILYIFFKIASLFSSTYLSNLIYHIPILLADIGIYSILKKLIPRLKNEILFFYCLSPIVLYASYIYSQHDLIPTYFVLLAAYLATKRKYSKSFWILGIAIAIKWHTLISLPLFLIYSYRKSLKIYKIPKYTFFSMIPLLISLLPFGNIENALNLFKIGESNLIFETYIQVKDLKVYLFPLIYSLIIIWAFRLRRYNTQLFISLNGIIFLSFIILVYPNPGWFIWSLPFMAYSFSKHQNRKKELFILQVLTSSVYLVFFTFLYSHPISDVDYIFFLNKKVSFYISDTNLNNIVFTLLISFLIISNYLVYISSIKNSFLFKRKFNAFLIGIAGDSGSGKTTLLKSINLILGSNSTVTLEGDGEHKWERGNQNWKETTHLNPKANYLHKQLSHLISLKKGYRTQRSDYNHETGKFNFAKTINPKDFIIIAGLHPFYLKGARQNIDFKIFLAPDESLRTNWKIVRDVEKRGYTQEKVIQQINDRKKDSENYIIPQKEFADLIITYKTKEDIKDMSQKYPQEKILVDYLISTDINLEPLLVVLELSGCKIIQHHFEKDLTRQRLAVDFSNIHASIYNEEFEEFFDSVDINGTSLQTGLNLLNQIIITYCIREKYSYE